jgi:hypothetical protein
MCFNDLVNRWLLEYHGDPGPLQGVPLLWPANIDWSFYFFVTLKNKQPDADNGTAYQE